MHPSHETRVCIAGGVWQDVLQESTMNLGEIGGRDGHGLAKMSPHLSRNGLPDGTLANVLDVVQGIVEHLVSLSPEGGPVGGVERFTCRRGGIGRHVLYLRADRDTHRLFAGRKIRRFVEDDDFDPPIAGPAVRSIVGIPGFVGAIARDGEARLRNPVASRE